MLKLYNIYNSPADWSIKIPNKYFTELKNTQFSRGKKKKITQTTGKKKKKGKLFLFYLLVKENYKRGGFGVFFPFPPICGAAPHGWLGPGTPWLLPSSRVSGSKRQKPAEWVFYGGG